jgi:hypothetical protein
MSLNRLFCCIPLLALLVITGCATKITLGPIDDSLKPSVQLTGKVHVMPIIDEAHITKLDNGYYTTASRVADTKFISESRPSDVVEKTINICLTQSGLVVTSGATVPEGTNLVLTPKLVYVSVGTSNPASAVAVNIAAAMITGMAGSGTTPVAGLGVLNTFESRQAQVKTMSIFAGGDTSVLHVTNGGGAERAFRLTEEKYCGWLQQKIAEFQTDPVAMDLRNKEEAALRAKRVKAAKAAKASKQ